jgi:hypothetical protein
LRDVNTICRRSWYIAAHVWKIYDFKIEVVPLIINFSKAVCSSGCVCFEQGLSCTDLCPCQAGEICRNSNTLMSRNKSIDDDDVDLLQLDVQELNC